MGVNWAVRAVLDSLPCEHPHGFCLEQWRRSGYGPMSTFSLLEIASCVRAFCKLSANSPLFLPHVKIEADKTMGCDYLRVLCNYMFQLGLGYCHLLTFPSSASYLVSWCQLKLEECLVSVPMGENAPKAWQIHLYLHCQALFLKLSSTQHQTSHIFQ